MVQTGEGSLRILSLQIEGKSKVSAAEFLRGYQIQKGERLGAKG
jgi:methionyl-tRNA formyltransferase